jgi:uncharacterized membrane protein YbaN (DUF454 family)
VNRSPQVVEGEPRIRIRPGAGSVRVEAAALFSPRGDAHIHDLVARLFQWDVVSAVDIDREGLAVVIHYDATRCSPGRALRTFAEALEAPRCPCPLGHSLQRIPGLVRRVERRRDRSASAAAMAIDLEPEELTIQYDSRDLRPPVPPADTPVQGGLQRLVNLVLGGASFVMSVVGIMTPFVPTMPFVLATGYFLSRASPRLLGLFRRSPLFGEMLCDWEELGGWRLRTKLKLFGLMFGLWGLTLAIVGVSMPLVITMGVVSSISVLLILRMPTVSDNRPAVRLDYSY